MLGLVVDSNAPGRIRLGEVPDAQTRDGEALVEVTASSINRGEAMRIATADDGHLFGWDVVGVVKRQAASGRGPGPGARVVGLLPAGGGWSQRAAVRAEHLAVIPDGVSEAVAAAVPVACLTALRAVRLAQAGPGSRVLVTGAAGAVGSFAVQLARIAGAQVTAAARNPVGAAERGALGDVEVIVGQIEGPPRFDAVIEAVGGDSLTSTLAVTAPSGRVVVVGRLGGDTASISCGELLDRGITLSGYRLAADVDRRPVGDDLARVMSWLGDGRLAVPATRQIAWDDLESLRSAFTARLGPGKPVLVVRGPHS
jgi:NADPH:quinone reductase-like Zn-dependent oxidoreductase